MKIDAQTIAVLKNFAKINPSIVFKVGNTLTTLSISKSIMAKAVVPTSFESKFAVYSLDKFIAALSMFAEPQLKFGDTSVVITDGKKKISYTYTNDEMVVQPKKDSITLPSIDASCTLTNEQLKDTEKALGILGLTSIAIVGDGQTISIQAVDDQNPTSHSFSQVLGETNNKFRAVFKSENVRLIPGDYDIDICAKGIAHFKGSVAEYWIAVETNSSTFE